MEKYWTSKKPINGLRHFVLVNETKEKENMIYCMVSVLDSEINLKITFDELMKSGNWCIGWINLPKLESITEEYSNFKSSNRVGGTDQVYINDDSQFNIF